ncbi:SoxR reducing system RseC family protein [Parvimonas sp. G1425]|uniref:SoxR reducing system RseC family protein n=1 Tax=Parvimonas sp. G1425 TaxID=3387694 RepID=UPI0039E6ABB4
MEQVGYITKILPEDKCKVLISRISGCKGTCKTCGGCPTPTMHIVMKNTLDAEVGDRVKIGIDSNIVLKYSIFLYGFPILMFILSILLVNIAFANLKGIDIIGFVVGLFTMFLAFLIVKLVDKKYAYLATKTMYMEEIISKKD